jgi:6-phosphogluconolactonase (cycloisomerase 2 family)
MALPRLFVSTGWLLALVAFGGCGDNSNHPNDLAGGGGDMAGDASSGPTVGGTVTGLAGTGLVLQNNGGDDLTVSASGAFTFATPLADGAAYDVSILTQPASPAQICAVANGKGTIAGGASVTSVAVRCAPVVRFVLVVDKLDGSVGTFALDAASGRLTYAGKSATGMQPISVATDPDGKFAWVANAGDRTVSQYAIDGNGRLSALSPATVTLGAVPFQVVVDPAGRHAYVVSSKSVAQYAVGADGTLTALSPATVSSGSGSIAIVLEPSGRFAYVADGSGSTVSQFSVGADGALTPLGTATVATGMVPIGIAVDPTGRFVYVTNGGDNTVSQYSIGSDGALAPLPTATVAAGTTATSPVVDPTGRFAFVLNPGDKTVSQYSIGSDGTLTPATTTAPVGAGADAVIVDGSGKFAWVVNDMDNTVGQYTIGSGGTLAPNAPATLRGQATPTALALVGGRGPAQPTASHAYVSDRAGSVRDFPVGANGVLGTPATIMTTGHTPQSIVLAPGGDRAYVLDNPPTGGAGNILQYAISSTGAWTALSPASVAAGTAPGSIALHPSGRFAYVANSATAASTISQFAIATDGTLTALSTPTANTDSLPSAVAVDPSGRFAYVATNDVEQYAIGADGTLTMKTTATVPGGNTSKGIAIDPSGRWAYVTNGTGAAVLQYAIDATDGHLTALTPASAASGASPQAVAIDPFGRYAYAISLTACTLSQYAIGSGGTLGPLSPASVAAGDCGAAMDFVAWVAVDPSGRYVYVPDEGSSSSSVLQYGIGTGGALAPLSPAATSALNAAQLERMTFLVRYQ